MPSRALCSYEGCKNSRAKNENLSFHRFPKDDRRDLWILHSGNFRLYDLTNQQLNQKFICNDHFTDSDVKCIDQKGMKKLKDTAIPIDKVTSAALQNSNDSSDLNTIKALPENCSELNDDIPLLLNNEPILKNVDETNCDQGNELSINSSVKKVNDPNNHANSVQKLQNELFLKQEELKKAQDTLKRLESTSALKMSLLKNKYEQKIKSKDVQIKKQYKRITNLTRKIKRHDKVSKEAIEFKKLVDKLDVEVKEFFNMQINHIKQKKWTDKEKQFAISLFYRSPKAYCYLRTKKHFKLPCISKIRMWVNELDLKPGKCSTLLSLLQIKSSLMTPKEKECILLWDEISIKTWLDYNSKKDIIEGFTDLGDLGRSPTDGNHVLVFMLRGRQTDWRQPISYYVSHNCVPGKKLSKLISDTLNYAENAGFKVKGMTCDLGTSNQTAINDLKITQDKPYIERFERKIFFNYDPPHVIKCLRNNLRKHDFQINDTVVSWGPIRELRDHERNAVCKSAPKLTDQHIDPNPFEMMNVSLATQIFSNSVSAALLAGKLSNANPLKHEHCISTANFLKKINDLFDCLNSRSTNDPNPLRKPLSRFNPQVKDYLSSNLEWIKSWNCKNIKQNPPSFNGFYLTINSVLMQWDEMQNDGNEYFLTSRLNQDPLENTFGALRNRSGHNSNPTAMQFRQNLQYTIYANLTSISHLTNCKADETVSLLAIPNMNNLQASVDILDEKLENVNTSKINISSNENIGVCDQMPDVDMTESDDAIYKDYIGSVKYVDSLDKSSPLSDADDSTSTCGSLISYKDMDEFVEDDTNSESSLPEVSNKELLSDKNIDNGDELININVINKSIFEKITDILASSTDSTTPYQNSIKYLAGYFAHKCLKKNKCTDCEKYFIRDNSNFESMSDLLLFFKAYKVSQNTNELGNLRVPTDEFAEIIRISLEVFDSNFNNFCYFQNVSKLLQDAIIIKLNSTYPSFLNSDESCKSHRHQLLEFFVRVMIFNNLKWINKDKRDSKKARKVVIANNKPNRKLQKMSHE